MNRHVRRLVRYLAPDPIDRLHASTRSWVRRSLELIGENDREAARRTSRNIQDRIRVGRARTDDLTDVVIEVIEIVLAELERQKAKQELVTDNLTREAGTVGTNGRT